MPDTVNGLPLHPLVVHAVVVLLPLACLGVIAIALRSSWRARYGGLVVAITVLATAAIPVATQSGEDLAHRVGDPGQHAALGDTLIWFALPLLAVAVALVVMNRVATRQGAATPAPEVARSPELARRGAATPAPEVARSPEVARPGDSAPNNAPRTSVLMLFVAAVAVIVAAANLVQVYRIGDSGARVVWQGVVANTPAEGR